MSTNLAVIAWLGFALAASCAFLRCLRFAKPRYTERNLRWVQFHVSHVSPARLELLEGFPRTSSLA